MIDNYNDLSIGKYQDIMVLLDYLTDDNAEDELTISQFMADAYRKISMLQALIEEWRKN